eukprot:gene10033-2352_t
MEAERKYKCDHEGCDKAYFYSHHLKRHQKLHLESRPEVCPVCSARFTKKCHLRKHIASTHKKNEQEMELSKESLEAIANCTPYSCTFDNCNKSFVTEGKLKKHLEKHEKKISHKCTFENCEETFAFRKELMKHINEEHEAKCSICGKILKNAQSLTKHLKIHEENQFRCPFDGCLKTYTRQSNLNVHIKKIHSEKEKKFKCDLCDQEFAYKSTLDRHIETVHEKIHPVETAQSLKKKKILTTQSFFPKTLVL